MCVCVCIYIIYTCILMCFLDIYCYYYMSKNIYIYIYYLTCINNNIYSKNTLKWSRTNNQPGILFTSSEYVKFCLNCLKKQNLVTLP